MPQYSFGMRTLMPGEELGPGPGAYKVDKLTRYGNSKGLEFSMAPRTNVIGEWILKDYEIKSKEYIYAISLLQISEAVLVPEPTMSTPSPSSRVPKRRRIRWVCGRTSPSKRRVLGPMPTSTR